MVISMTYQKDLLTIQLGQAKTNPVAGFLSEHQKICHPCNIIVCYLSLEIVVLGSGLLHFDTTPNVVYSVIGLEMDVSKNISLSVHLCAAK